ncbi:MAG: tetratricopeptide repeat protein [Psychromonas sp.]|nr:tetratricopeptide repeat protein [Psychromonas sp.]
MRIKITVSGLYIRLIILFLSLGLFSCSTTNELRNGEREYQSNRFSDLFEDRQSSQRLDKSESAVQAIASAVEAEQKGDLNKALFYYIQSLQFEPENAAVFIKIAQIHEHRGNNEIAARAYSQAVKNNPTLIKAYQGLGVVNLEMRKYKQAQESLQKAISLDQKRLQEKQAQKEGDYYRLDKESPIEPYNVLGIIEDMNHNFDLARVYYKLALNANENSANVLSNIGYSCYLTGELNSAERYFKRAINVDAKFKRAWTNLGLIYIRKGQYNRAIKTLKQVMQEFEAYNDLGYFLMLDGRLEEAEYFFQKAINMSPSYFEKAYSNLEQLKIKKRELWLLENEAKGKDIAKLKQEINFDYTRSGISE